MLSRRAFLRRTSLVSLYPLVPTALGRVAQAAAPIADSKILVVIQLDGGNDGINTVVPYGDDAYGRNRDALRLDTDKLHKLNDHIGLHPQMRAAKELYDDGRLTIVQGVGYPNPNRSHFQSMRIWQTARIDEAEHNSYGWLGRALDLRRNEQPSGEPAAIYAGSDEVPIALWGRRAEAISLSSLDDLKLPFDAAQITTATDDAAFASSGDALNVFVTRQVLSAYAAADQAQTLFKSSASTSSIKYPSTQLGTNLQLISQIIQSGADARVYHTLQGGYDTHAAQLYTHARLLSEFSDGLKAFLDDLKDKGLDDRVAVLAFSEFGRRLKENSSQGTDHGAAGPVFVAGRKTVGGLVGSTPNLADLDDGDLKMGIDLREIYTAILEDWLGVGARSVLGGTFGKAMLLQS
jgi:uncharacterized protein (DUF1501 family)